MGSQSFIMMYEAGAAWQYGKRRISAMSNEEFNKLTPLKLLEEHTALLRSAIPTIQKSMEDMSPLVRTIMVQFGEYIAEAVKAFPEALGAIAGGDAGSFRGDLARIGASQALVSNAGAQFGGVPTGQDVVNMLVSARSSASSTPSIKSPSGVRVPVRKIAPYQGPGINPHTGSMSDFLKAIMSLPSPAPHIKSRISNVSLQSLTIERNRQWDRIAVLVKILQVRRQALSQGRGSAASVNDGINAVNTAKQKLSDFLQMHGIRF